jgi:hypothetical protein
VGGGGRRGGGKREREREGGGDLTSGSKSGDHRLQILGHNGEEREMEERRLLLKGKCALGPFLSILVIKCPTQVPKC